MSITFRRGIRENVSLIIGLIGPTGSGKTFSAMELAAGISGKDSFAVIDTEARRSLHYADRFNFDHGDLLPPFRPESYIEAILAADKAGYPAIVVDSCSHEWAGAGGVLEWHEEELQRMAGDDWRKREQCKMAAWIKPKMQHKKMVQNLLQVRAQLILCFRAEEKTKLVKNAKGKMEPVPIGWQPICEKNLPYELICSFLLSPDNPGLPIPLKLEEQHKGIFGENELITKEMGIRLHSWATGAPKIEFISKDQIGEIWALAQKADMSSECLGAWILEKWGAAKSTEIKLSDFEAIKKAIEALIKVDVPEI